MHHPELSSFFVAVGVLCGALLCAGCANSADSPAVTLERARILLDRDQLEEAIPLFSEAIAAMPEDAEARYLRGLAYEKLNVLEKALVDYTECLRLDEDRPDALNNRAVVLAKLKRFDDAAVEFSRLVALDPQDPLAYRNRGLCHFDLEHYDAALLDYDKAIQLAPNEAAGWFQRGNVFLEQNENIKAAADYSQAIALDEKLAKAWMNRGVARYHNGEKAVAAADLQKAQSLDDNIILPGLDFFAESPSIEGTAAAQISNVWPTLRSIAEQDLLTRGFTGIKVVQEFPSLLCAELSGIIEGRTQTILLTVCPKDQHDLTVPSPDSVPFHYGAISDCCLLVLEQSESGAATARVSHFEPHWKPDEQSSRPVIIRCHYPRAPVVPPDSAGPVRAKRP